MSGETDTDALFEAAFAPQKMSRAERKAWAWVNAGSTMQTLPPEVVQAPTTSGWVRAFRYDYCDDDGAI